MSFFNFSFLWQYVGLKKQPTIAEECFGFSVNMDVRFNFIKVVLTLVCVSGIWSECLFMCMQDFNNP